MPIYIPPTMRGVRIGTPTELNDLFDVSITNAKPGDSLVYNGTVWGSENMATQGELDKVINGVVNITGGIQSQINILNNETSDLQIQINEITTGIKVVFCEEFIGQGGTSSCTLNGAITNGSFISGGWASINVANTLPVNITDLSGKPIYDSTNLFTRHRINVTGLNSSGLATFDYTTRPTQDYKIWYFYSFSVNDRIHDYYRDDFVASMEESVSDQRLASQIQVNTVSFDGTLGATDTTVQQALDTLDDHTHSFLNLSDTPKSYSGVNGYVLAVSGSSIYFSNSIQNQINQINSNLSNYTLLSTSANISANQLNTNNSFQRQINDLASVTGSYITPDSIGLYATVKSVGLSLPSEFIVTNSPVTGSGTLSGSWASHAPNLIFASPISGSAGSPEFRSLVISDIPSLPINKITGRSSLLSCGVTSVPTVTVGATGLLNASSMVANLNPNSDYSGDISSFIVPALNNYQLAANTYYYLTVIYNSGSPIYSVITDNTLINHSDRIAVCNIFWENIGAINEEHMFHVGTYGYGLSNKIAHRLIHTQRFGWQDGLTLSDLGSRIISVSSGTVWYDGLEIALVSTDSGTTPYHLYYHSSPGVWAAEFRTQYSNTEYDDGTGLHTVGNNRYGVNWVYRSVSGSDLFVVLGTSNYTLIQAQASQPPSSLPTLISKQGILVGRIIIKRSATVATQIDSAFSVIFSGSGIISHNDTSAIQGGVPSEYYHLSQSEYNDLIGKSEVSSISGNLNSSKANIVSTGQGTWNNVIVNSEGIVTSGAYVNYGGLVDLSPYTLLSVTQSISGSLDTKINSEITNRQLSDINIQSQVTNLTSVTGNYLTQSNLNPYSLTSTVANISASLSNSINSEITNRQLADNSLQSQISNIGSITGNFASNSNLSSYTLLSVTQSISGSLDTKINSKANISHSIESHSTISNNTSLVLKPDGIGGVTWGSVSVSGGGTSDHNALLNLQGGTTNQYYHLNQSQFSDFIGKSEVASVSGNLSSSKATAVSGAQGTWNKLVVNSQGIVVSGGNFNYGSGDNVDLSPYTLLSTTAAISGNLQHQIDNLVITGGTIPETSKTFSWNLDGSLQSIVDTYGTKSFGYLNGNLVSISGTGVYLSKNFYYDINGNLINIVV